MPRNDLTHSLAVVGILSINPGLRISVRIIDGVPVGEGRYEGDRREALPAKRAHIVESTVRRLIAEGLIVPHEVWGDDPNRRVYKLADLEERKRRQETKP